MLRDYFWSMTIVALLLVGYTTLVILNYKKPTPEIARAAVSSVKPNGAAASSAAATP